ncbi:MarR family transcriptional regulator [Ameyamaea chiangmaiensis NBRC 103196]|uniref:MarR family transcriptional regulator n=1 Tax=Ameyamaea chiangmaiensis TaxID=442969 RepID=A0A850PCW6_9PROT|nr:MarR family transcriptional regulator [Ameyamaea chiangmaiensis]MBS4075208.1 MarR family transcriptional regulator [Ameyamaea chiangmaiensis]NVN41828.1 MarR family transcriptional regulator [Ameyamaea chiangmaiensis]GBQ66407.1 MarR family transcriptional regulator [Ameyamaea chiangmaiensis NBRC 103196]
MLTQAQTEERSQLERRFGQKIVRLATAWRREIDVRLRPLGMSDATWRPIFYLAILPPPIHQTDLARAMSIEAPSLGRLLDVLEKRGLIARETDSRDRRSKRVSLTEEGTRFGREVLDAVHGVAGRLLADISVEELRLCAGIFDRVDSAARAGTRTGPGS